MTARALNVTELHRAMLARGLEQRDLVTLSGLSPATVSRMRRGHPVTATTVRRLVTALERVPVSALATSLLSDGRAEG